jgi:hypothetical protein
MSCLAARARPALRLGLWSSKRQVPFMWSRLRRPAKHALERPGWWSECQSPSMCAPTPTAYERYPATPRLVQRASVNVYVVPAPTACETCPGTPGAPPPGPGPAPRPAPAAPPRPRPPRRGPAPRGPPGRAAPPAARRAGHGCECSARSACRRRCAQCAPTGQARLCLPRRARERSAGRLLSRRAIVSVRHAHGKARCELAGRVCWV